MRWCYKCINDYSKNYYAGVQNACLQRVERQGALQTFEILLLFPKILFENIFELTHTSKIEQKT